MLHCGSDGQHDVLRGTPLAGILRDALRCAIKAVSLFPASSSVGAPFACRANPVALREHLFVQHSSRGNCMFGPREVLARVQGDWSCCVLMLLGKLTNP